MVGTTLSHFRLLEKIGAGGMGVVYRAHDERLDRDVALKLLASGALADDEVRGRFRREALALSHLNHPNIATIHEFDSEDGTDFLVMELITGTTLLRRLEAGPMAEAEVIRLGIQIADGLAAAHESGVLHRDLKPSNLGLTPDGRLKVLDFGLAKWFEPRARSDVDTFTTTGEVIAGTLPYMAPEQMRCEPLDARTDLYAAGAVLYEMATGARLFPETAGLPLLDAILNREPRSPQAVNPSVSAALAAVILKAIHKERDKRFESARALSAALERLAAPVENGHRAAPPGALRGPTSRWPSAAGFASVAAVALLIGFNVGGGRDRLMGLVPRSAIHSLAVLPLANISHDPDQEYFAEGMTDELISALAQVAALRVTSRTSVMAFRNQVPSLPEIARKLGVSSIVEGTVAQSNGRVRISIRLIDANHDRQVWAQSYDRDLQNVLQLQSEVAAEITREIQIRMTPEERARLVRPRPLDPVAYELYLKGRYQWNRRTPESLRRAIEYFDRAIAKDPGSALAYCGLADAVSARALYGLEPPLEVRGRALAAATKALALDSLLSDAHASIAHLHHNLDWDWVGAERSFRRAIQLNPSNALAHHYYGHLLVQLGRFDEGMAEVKRAHTLDPLSAPIDLGVAVVHYYQRHYDLALEDSRNTAELDSTYMPLHRLRAAIFALQGHEDQAVDELAKSLEVQGQGGLGAALRQTHRASGFVGALNLMAQALIRKRAGGLYEPAEHIAEFYTRSGQRDEAFRWLHVSLEEHDTELVRLKVDPIFDPLRSDPRYQDLLGRVGLAQSSTS